MTEIQEIETTDSLPVEYQIFALCLRVHGSIKYFFENLPEEEVGTIHGEIGINEFYKALLSFTMLPNLKL